MKLVCACAVFVVLFRPSLAALLVSRPTLYPFLYLLQPTGPAAVLSRQYVQDRMVEVTIYIYIYSELYTCFSTFGHCYPYILLHFIYDLNVTSGVCS